MFLKHANLCTCTCLLSFSGLGSPLSVHVIAHAGPFLVCLHIVSPMEELSQAQAGTILADGYSSYGHLLMALLKFKMPPA